MKNLKIPTILIALVLTWLMINQTALAATFQSTLTITAKDANYQTLKNIAFTIYKQKTNVDGQRIPGDSAASGNTKETGMAEIKLNVDNRQPMYLIKFYAKNSTVGAIYFYDIDLSNVYTYNFIARLSSLRLTLKDAEGNLPRNQKFNLYTQKGVSGVTYLKGETYATGLTTGVSGYYDAFLGEGTYLMEIPLSNNLILQKGNIKVTKERQTDLIYVISEMMVTAKDENGLALPKQKFEIHSQANDAKGNPALGKLILNGETDQDGIKKLFLPPAVYALKFIRVNNQSENLFNQVLSESNLLVVNYSTSGLKLIVKDANGLCVKNKLAEIFIQKCATCGEVVANKVASGKTNESGEINFKLTSGIYVVKIAGQKGFDYYLYDQKISAGQTKTITERLSLIRIISRKASGEVLKNAKITISSQKLDINKKPLADKAIATLDTKDTGQAELYLPPGNYIATFNKNQIASLSVKRGHLTKLSIIDNVKNFSYPIEIISLGPIDERETPKKKNLANFYGQKRLGDLAQEQTLAKQLKEDLEKILGKGKIGVARENWPVLINSYIYGGYTPAEIAHTIKNGPLAVHPEIPAANWRDSADYQKYLERIK